MERKYISDIITENEICQWRPGDRILIESQTGSGKSEFIKKNLYNYCKKNNKMILLMSNRNLLKNQNMEDLGDKTKYIRAHNYQEYESRILGGFDIFELFESYDYVVYDEAHYFFSDSQFNKNTDLLIGAIKNTPKDKIFLFITATPQALLDYQPKFNFRYQLPYDYSYIKDIYFYNKDHRVPIVETIIDNIQKDEKILYFGSNGKDIYDLSLKFEDASFICSSGNKLYDKADLEAISDIAKKSRFKKRILFSTKYLDNGVNLIDKSLKHIFIDMIDPISFIQCLGRKRIVSPDDQITLYVKNYNNNGSLWYIVSDLEDKIELVNNFKNMSRDDFKSKYQKNQFDNVIDADYKIKISKHQHHLTQKKLINDIIIKGDQNSYRKYICKLLSFDYSKSKNADEEFEKITLEDLMGKYLGIKLFDKDQDRFKTLFFDKVFMPKKINYSKRGKNVANRILEENNSKYIIASRRDKKGANRDKVYWIVEIKEEDNNVIE
jgi:hypothetical protein